MTLYIFGSNAISQLGLGEDYDDTHVPTILPFFNDKNIKKISCGTLHTLVVTDDNKLYTWGCNDEFALGRDGDESVPGEVVLPEEPVDVAGGASISACITKNNNLYSWGTFRNFNGVYGFSKGTLMQEYPKRIHTGLSNFKFSEIKSGANFVSLVSTNKLIYTFGSNDFYELGRRTSARHNHSSLFPEPIFSGRSKKENHRFRAVGVGLNHAIGINTDNEVYTWGSNIYGQLGIGHAEQTRMKHKLDLTNIKDVAGGEHHTLFLTNEGDLYGCGRNDEGQLGIPNKVNYNVPTKIGISSVDKIRSHSNFSICQIGNELYSFGCCFSGGTGFEESNVFEPTKIPFEFPKIIDFSVGSNFTVVHTE